MDLPVFTTSVSVVPTIDAFDQVIAALCLYREARGETVDAKRGVLWVLHNRMEDEKKRWPTTLSGVVLQPFQFSSFNRNDPNSTLIPDAKDAVFQQCCGVVDDPGTTDPTNGANAYHSIPEGGKLPPWAEASKITARIGKFTFYKL